MSVAQELGFGGIAENSLDAVSNRDFVLDYLVGRRHLRHAPVAAGRARSCCGRARSSASARSPTRSRRARASCPRRRTPTPPSSCGRRRRGWPGAWHPPRRAPRPAADLQQGPPGGQGAALRRGRHARAVPAGRPPAMLATHHVRPRAPGRRRRRRVPGRDGRRRPAGQARRAVPRGPRDRRRAGPGRARARQDAVRAGRRGAGRAGAAAGRRGGGLPRAAGRRGWLESKVSEGGTSLARVRDQLAQARHVLEDSAA